MGGIGTIVSSALFYGCAPCCSNFHYPVINKSNNVVLMQGLKQMIVHLNCGTNDHTKNSKRINLRLLSDNEHICKSTGVSDRHSFAH